LHVFPGSIQFLRKQDYDYVGVLNALHTIQFLGLNYFVWH